MTVSTLQPDSYWDTLVLERGPHATRDEGVCFMEAVSLYAAERWFSDQPECASAFLEICGQCLNDALDDDHRQLLKPLVKLVPGSAGADSDRRRGFMLADWAVREWLPVWLPAHASTLRGLPPICDTHTALDAAGTLLALRPHGADYDQRQEVVGWLWANPQYRPDILGSLVDCRDYLKPEDHDGIQRSAVELYERMLRI